MYSDIRWIRLYLDEFFKDPDLSQICAPLVAFYPFERRGGVFVYTRIFHREFN